MNAVHRIPRAAAALLAAGCGGDAPTAPAGRDLRPAAVAPIIESHHVDTSVAAGTIAYTGLCEPRVTETVVTAGTPLSDELAQTIATTEPLFTGDPAAAAQLVVFGTLMNLEFLTQDLPNLGDAGAQIAQLAQDEAAALSGSTGVPFTADVSVVHAEDQNYGLFGGVINGGATIVVGDATVTFYRVTATVHPADHGPDCGGGEEPPVGGSPRARKSHALALLTAHAGDGLGHHLDKAIEHLQRSLDPALWVDDAHLDPKHGKRVFHEEAETAREIARLEREDLSGATRTDLDAALADMLAADRILAGGARDGIACSGRHARGCERLVDRASWFIDHLAMREADRGHTDQAVLLYGAGWALAQQAIRLGGSGS